MPVGPEDVGQNPGVRCVGLGSGDAGAVAISCRGQTGPQITMTPPGDDPVLLRIADVVGGELFVDEARFNGLLLRTIHRIDRIDQNRIRVVYRMEITGTGADEAGPQIGPGIIADWPETMASLAELALR
ncbi:polyketide cyclase [Streptomyces sp. NPDC101213]|uniref:polyketide cyclase n=1 Tax=Streptomyces sp. NPDC101213 TaxID=3366130 RepID=UPI0038133B78